MSRKRYTPEQIIGMLREAEVRLSQGETLAYPQTGPAHVTAMIVTMKPGKETGPHRHGVPTFGYILEGQVTVDYSAKGTRTYRKGDGFMEAEVVTHNGVNDGTGRCASSWCSWAPRAPRRT